MKKIVLCSICMVYSLIAGMQDSDAMAKETKVYIDATPLSTLTQELVNEVLPTLPSQLDKITYLDSAMATKDTVMYYKSIDVSQDANMKQILADKTLKNNFFKTMYEMERQNSCSIPELKYIIEKKGLIISFTYTNRITKQVLQRYTIEGNDCKGIK